MAADTKIVLTAEDRTLAAFQSAKRNLDGLSGGIAKLSGLLTGLGIGGAITGAGLAAFVKSSIDAADEMGKLSQRVGVGTEALSALNYAASLSDVSTESMANGLKKLAVNAADTAKGTGEARDAFAALGINVKDSTGNLKGADVLMGEVAAQFAQFEDGAAKTALAVKLFGKAGADLIPMLNAGAQGLADMRAEAERLGIIISPEQAKAAEEFNDSLTRMESRAKGVGFAMSGPLLEGMNGVLERWSRAAELSGKGYNFFDLLFGVGINPVGDTVDQLEQVNQKIAYTQKKLDSVRAGGGDFFGLFKPEELQFELEQLQHLKGLLEGLDMEAIGGNKYKGNTDFIREQEAAIAELSKLDPPKMIDEAAEKKRMDAVAKDYQRMLDKMDAAITASERKRSQVMDSFAKRIADINGDNGPDEATPDALFALQSKARELSVRANQASGEEASRLASQAEDAANRAADVIARMNESGRYNDLQATGALRELEVISLRAADALKNVPISIDKAKATEEADAFIDAMQSRMNQRPLVVQVVTAQGSGGGNTGSSSVQDALRNAALQVR